MPRWERLTAWLMHPASIVPLVGFRIAFGLLMFVSAVRFAAKGWIDSLYIAPPFHFTYVGFGWLRPLPGDGMYVVFFALAVLALLIAAGAAYRVSMTVYFLLFTYVELLDKTYYLNHYYFISLLSFLLIFLPLHRAYSVDAWLRPALRTRTVPAWTINAIRLQLGLVYFFAGVAKLNADWLFHAMPLKIWLRGNTHLPLVGRIFAQPWAPYAMSWAGAAYDLTMPLWMSWRRTRPFAYVAVLTFHVLTALMFPIGMFPWIMIVSTLIFFSEEDYAVVGRFLRRILRRILRRADRPAPAAASVPAARPTLAAPSRLLSGLLVGFFVLQAVLPLRHWLYPGDTNWTQEGFRYSWRVMLVEATGFTTFNITDPATGRAWSIFPAEYLTPFQEAQMVFQPDMILEFAHYLDATLAAQGYGDVEVRAEAYVSVNGRSSRLLIDPTVDLSAEPIGLAHKPWILP